MAKDETTELRVIESADQTRIVLRSPPAALCLPQRRQWGDRISAGIFIFLSLGMLGTFTANAFHAFPCFLPLDNAVNIVSACVGGFALCFVWTIGIILLFVATAGLFPQQVELAIDSEHMTECWRRGPFRWTRRVPVAAIQRVTVGSIGTVDGRVLRRPLEQRRARIRLDSGRGLLWAIRGIYPYPTARAAADELVSRLNRVRQNGPAAVVEFADTIDPAFFTADAPTPPLGCTYRVDTLADGQRIHDPSPRWRIADLLLNRATAYLLGSLSLPATAYLSQWLIGSLHEDRRDAALWMCLLLVGVWLLVLCLMIWMRVLRVSFHLSPQALSSTRHGPLSSYTRTWARSDIAAITVGRRLGLELWQTDGKRFYLAGGDVLTLRYLATLMRHTLGVPAQADLPPANCPFTAQATSDGMIIEKPAKGFHRAIVVRLVFSGLMLAAAVVAAAIGMSRSVSAHDRPGVLFLAATLACVGAITLLAALHEAVERWTVSTSATSVTFTRRTILGTRRRHWRRMDLVSIGSCEPRLTRSDLGIYLMLTTNTGRTFKPLKGLPEPMEHLAKLLRQTLKLPAAQDLPSS